MDELADTDGPSVAVAADADGDEALIGQHRSGPDRRHTAVDGVEAVRPAQKVRRTLARATDARELDDLPGVDAHLEKGIDDSLGNRVVAAAGAESGLPALVGLGFQSDSIHLQSRHEFSVRFPFDTG